MNEDMITQYILDTFRGVDTVTADGNTFFFYDPEHKFPFVTLVTNDAYEQISDLDRPGVFRLNIGIGKQSFRALFGVSTPPADPGDAGAGGYDFTALDQLMPHPVYGRMYWMCVLNPSAQTFETAVQPLLAEAYQLSVGKYGKRRARG
jgi:hypothetical protein